MDGTAMPEAPIDEHGDAGAREHKIRASPRADNWPVNAET
jgi:hypothetical protein